MFVQNNKTPSNKIVFYFHGNGEDIGYANYFLEPIMEEWEAHGVAIEYPSYGLYTSGKVSLEEKQFDEDGRIVFDFVCQRLGIDASQTIIFGRSIGSGPSTLLAYQKKPAAFFLFSPLKSVKSVAKDKVSGLVALLVPDIFKNIDLIDKIQSPTFIIHGKRDEVIGHNHSEELHQKSASPLHAKQLHLVDRMSHNRFDLDGDFIIPSKEFLKKLGLVGGGKKGALPIPSELVNSLFQEKPPAYALEEDMDEDHNSSCK